jgi:hypothetical protein
MAMGMAAALALTIMPFIFLLVLATGGSSEDPSIALATVVFVTMLGGLAVGLYKFAREAEGPEEP